MQNKLNKKLILDTWCEVYDLLKPWAHDEFWDFSMHETVPGAIYLIGRKQFIDHTARIRDIVEKNIATVFLSNPAEGSETLAGQCYKYGIADLAIAGKIPLIGGGDMDARWTYLQYDSFLPKMLDYDENVAAINRTNEIYSKVQKPYKFLFLNGRMRPHRKFLIEAFAINGLLDQSLWTILDAKDGPSQNLTLMHQGRNQLRSVRPVQYLDPYYEFDFYQDRVNTATSAQFVKNHLFNNTWGEIYLKAEPYIDTYFSLVTETVFDYPHSFRTEKIWKPIAMGHPFIVVSNAGYYRDLHNMGFKTFGHVIDESFDEIQDHQTRIERIVQVVNDLCQTDLAEFLKQCYNVCKYNQQHLATMTQQVRGEFPDRFFQFLREHNLE